MQTAQKLKPIIYEKSPLLGATPEGKAWCLKALHPSDPSFDVSGIPDKSAIPSVMINYQSTARYGPPAGTVLPWNFAATLLPHPVNFGFATPVDGLGAVGDFTAFLNQQLDGATHAAKMVSFLGQCERWRLAYMGVSIHFDGPALANQGTIVCNQTASAPQQFNACYTDGDGLLRMYRAICTPDSNDPAVLGSDFPDYDRSASMPNSYTAEIKEGLYVPLKLTKTCQKWSSKSDLVFWTDPSAGEYGFRNVPVGAAGGVCSYPHPGLEALLADATGAIINGKATSPLLNDVVAHVCGRNISPQAAIVLTFRVGIEAQVEPGSLLSPYQRVSPQYDSEALKAYFLVSRELKDAFPVEFNDLGKLWGYIDGALKTVAPLLTKFVHPLAGGAAEGVRWVGNTIASRSKAKHEASAAVIQRVKQAVSQGLTAPAQKRAVSRPKKKTRPAPAPAAQAYRGGRFANRRPQRS